MYLHPEMETLTRPEIEKLQLERLQKTVRHCMNSPFYKKRFEDNHLKPEDIRSLNDLRKIPFTTKQDLSLRNGCRSFGEGSPFAFIQWHNR